MTRTTTSAAIAAVRDLKKERDAADAALLQGVVAWTVEHRVEHDEPGLVTAATFGANGVLLGGVGCPLVSEFDVYDLATGLGLTSEAGCAYVARVLELRYRLRHTWQRVIALDVPVWKAFKVADATMNLTYEAARFVDQMLAPTLHSCTFAQIERTLAQAIDLHDPEEAERRRRKAADDRSFDIHLDTAAAPITGTTGTVAVEGTLALEDALDLDRAIKDGAQALGDLGCEESLDVRRAMALGEMARHQLALDLESETGAGSGGRGVTLFAHLDADSLHATVDNPGCGHVLVEQVKAWCQSAGTTVTVRPVIDLNTEISTTAYSPSPRLVEQVRLRDQVCVFPHCTRRARSCDLDHRDPFDKLDPTAGGRTTTRNLALLCRRHHRAKTFSVWTYGSPEPGVYEWTSPSGLRYRVTRGHRHGRSPRTTELRPARASSEP